MYANSAAPKTCNQSELSPLAFILTRVELSLSLLAPSRVPVPTSAVESGDYFESIVIDNFAQMQSDFSVSMIFS